MCSITTNTRSRWVIERSHLVRVPSSIEASSFNGLRHSLQKIADDADRGFGELQFRYELDSNDCVTLVHSYFVDRTGRRRRFMRLVPFS